MPDIHHWFHVYAGGDWRVPVAEHIDAMKRSGLDDVIKSLNVGVVGSSEQRADALEVLELWDLDSVAEADDGWEQVTLAPMYEWAQNHDGLICYTHTKGASRNDPIDRAWRRDMEYHNVIEWERIVEALTGDFLVAGAHWITDDQSDHAGMFGGNFWWVRADLLRHGEPPKNDYRHRAEEWLGDLGRVESLVRDVTVFDLCPKSITAGDLCVDW